MKIEELKDKTVLVRLDFNVPVQNGKIKDAKRILNSKKTIDLLAQNNCKVVLISHYKRPKNKEKELSFQNILTQIEDLLGVKIIFSVLEDAKESLKNMQNGSLLMLENIRFYKEEEQNELSFAKKLASLGDFYVNDAFSVCHRSHASVVGIPKFLPSLIGFSCQAEVDALSKINTSKKSVAIVGGSKISGKLPLIFALLKKVDKVIVGGALVNTILKKQGFQIGHSLYEEVDFNLDLKNIFVPFDFVTSAGLEDNNLHIVDMRDIPKQEMILDIGPASVIAIKNIIQDYDTIFWNGPLGAFEHPPFDAATIKVARAISFLTKTKGAQSILGGGDTSSAVSGFDELKFSYVSSAGGAFLKFLEEGGLVGLDAVYTS